MVCEVGVSFIKISFSITFNSPFMLDIVATSRFPLPKKTIITRNTSMYYRADTAGFIAGINYVAGLNWLLH